MSQQYDLVVLGAGPGGYIAAIRAAQLGQKVAIIEKEHLGGVCLNKGCIPTKALLKSAHSIHELKQLSRLGVDVTLNGLKPEVAVQRSRQISERISKGVGFLMKKNEITVYDGEGTFLSDKEIRVGEETLTYKNCIIATGAHYKTFPGLEHDGDRLIGAWEALKMEQLPESIAVIGAGAIGVEFAYFWNAFGVNVHIFEMQDHLLPLEDEDSSKEVERAYKKLKIKMSLGVQNLQTENRGDHVIISCEEKGVPKEYQFDKALIAVGMTGNLEGFGLETIGVELERGFIKVNEMYQTNVSGIYAIGDVSGPPLLAHVASHEGVIAVEHMLGKNPHKLVKMNIPGCTYCQPQVASVGETERSLKEKGIEYSVGKLPFTANGKALASNETTGFVKTLIGSDGELLGAHIVGAQATELIHEYVLFKSMEGISEDIINTVHPHPTLGEWLSETVMNAQGRSLNF